MRHAGLSFTFGIAGALDVIARVMAGGATDPRHIQGGGLIRQADGHAAGMARHMGAGAQIVRNADALVKDEAFALPHAVGLWHGFKVFQDAATQVEHIVDPFGTDKGRRLFTPDAPGAEHRDSGRTATRHHLRPSRPEPCGKFTKRPGGGIDRTRECTDRDLVIIARIDHDGIRVRNQVVPLCGLHIMTGIVARINVGHAHRHDLALGTDLHAVERHTGGAGFLDIQTRASRQCTDMRQHMADPRIAARNGAVDPLCRDQQRPTHALFGAYPFQRRTQGKVIGKRGKAVQRRNPHRQGSAGSRVGGGGRGGRGAGHGAKP